MKKEANAAKLTTSACACDPAFLLELKCVLTQYAFDVIHFNNGLHGMGYTEEQYRTNVDVQKKVSRLWFKNLVSRMESNGFDINALDVWTAHNQGVSGLNQILKGDVSAGVLKNIRNQAGMDENSTVQNYRDYYKKRLR